MKQGTYKNNKRKLANGGFIGSNADTILDAGLDITSMIPGIGGAVAGGVKLGKQLLGGLGVFGKTADEIQAEKLQKREEEIAKETARKAKTLNDQSIIKTYPTNGVEVTGFYKNGGVLNPKYNVEKGEVIQGTDVQLEEGTKVASDVIKVGGAKHENGGTDGRGGERVYSDNIKVNPELINILKSSGIKVSGNETYADVATKLGRMKGRYEKKNDIDNSSKITKSKMLERIDGLMNTTFETQEASKQPTDMQQPIYRKGGMLPKLKDGKRITDPMKKVNPIIPSIPSLETNINVNPLPTENVDNTPVIGIGKEKLGINFNNASDFIKDNSGNIANVATYLMNNRTINSIKTNNEPVLNSAPTYNYVDRSGKDKGDLNTAFNTASEGIDQASSQSTASNKAALFAEKISKTNDINQSENLRKDNYDADFNNRLINNSNVNNSIINRNNIENMNRNNEVTAYRLNNRNSLLQGIMGNNAVLRQEKMDLMRLAIEKYKDGDRGVFNAMMQDPSMVSIFKSLGIDINKANKTNGK